MTAPDFLRDAWIAELWRPCPEWHQTKDETADAQDRNARLAESCGEPELPLLPSGKVA